MKMGTRVYNAYTSWVGGAIALFSPRVAGNFMVGRNMVRTYMAGEANDADRGYRPIRRSGDAEVKRAHKLVVARCRDQAQNNPLISGAIERVCANVVRDGILPQFKFKKNDGKLDREANAKWRAQFDRWARYCDVTGHDSYGALQKLGLRHMWVDGQYFIHRVYDTSLKGIVPLRLELLEYDMLDPMVDGVLANGNIARKGIEHDANTGKPLAYHFFDQHPGDYLSLGRQVKSRRILASEIIHVWDRRRISQFSGISWLHSVVMESYRMEDFRHITQDAARLQSNLHAFLESAMPGFNAGMMGLPAGGQASPYTAGGDTGATEAPKELVPNAVQTVPVGTKMNFLQPTHPGNNYEPFVKDSQRWQSAGWGMSFEAYTNNYTDSSYASARSGSLEERLSYRGQQQFLEEKQNRRILAWFIEAAYISGLAPVKMIGYAADPLRYHEMADGQKPGWGWVDPRNDATASGMLLDLALDTRRNQCAQRGTDWDQIMDTSMDEEERLYALAELKAKRLQLEEKNNANA